MSEIAQAPVEGRVLDGPRWEVLHWKDIDYLARVRLPYELAMDFEVYEVVSWGSMNYSSGQPVESVAPLLHRADWHDSGELTEDVEESRPLFHGRVKWDGCSDWAWNTDRIMWHACGPEGVDDLAEAMRRAYALAAERIDRWLPDL